MSGGHVLFLRSQIVTLNRVGAIGRNNLFKAMLGQFKNGLKMTVKGGIAEGDKLSLEAESLGHLTNGRTYNQHYHFFI